MCLISHCIDTPLSFQSSYSNDQLERAKKQVEDVRGIMSQNVERVIARGEKLDDLEARANNLSVSPAMTDFELKNNQTVIC